MPPTELHFTAVRPYVFKGETFHGTDWILSGPDRTCVHRSQDKAPDRECESVLRYGGTAEGPQGACGRVAQNYRNIQDALDGKTEWVNDGLPSYPLILTLEDWYIFSPRVKLILDQEF